MSETVRPRASSDSEGRELWSLLVELGVAHVRTHFHRVIAELDLSPPQAYALRRLEPERPLPMRDLADGLACDASNVTGIVDRLERRVLWVAWPGFRRGARTRPPRPRGDQGCPSAATRRSRTSATPSSRFDAVTSSASRRTSGCALATATAWPAQASIGRSLGMSPKAITAPAGMPRRRQTQSSAEALVTPAAEISTRLVPE